MKELSMEVELKEMNKHLKELEAKRDRINGQIRELKADMPVVKTFIGTPREAECGWTEWWDVYNRIVFTTAVGCDGRVGGFRGFSDDDWDRMMTFYPEILTGKEYACKVAYYPNEDGVQFACSDEMEDIWRVKIVNAYPLTDDEADYMPVIG